MSEIQLAHLSFSVDARESRNTFHDTALREARIATDARQPAPVAITQAGFVSRLRLAFAGPSTTDACNCPA